MPGAYEMYLALENMDDATGTVAMESAMGGIATKSLISIIDQINSNYTRWYAHQQGCLRNLANMVHSVNAGKLAQLSAELKQLTQNQKALKKKMRERGLSKEEQDAARREFEATKNQIRRIDEEYENLLTVIQVPARISAYYGNATQAYGRYQTIISQEVDLYTKFVENPIWEREPPNKIRDGANAMLKKLLDIQTKQLRSIYDDITMAGQAIVAMRVEASDKMVSYPIKNFTDLYKVLADSRRELNPLIYGLNSIRNELRARAYGDTGNQYDNERYAAQVKAVSVIINDASDYWRARCDLEIRLIEKCEFPAKK